MTESHADSHDADKLARWQRDLPANTIRGFPVHAVFLVSADDRAAHDIFRQYRSSFESLGAGFEHLVIFGQHGVSRAELNLLSEFGLSEAAIPTLVLAVPSQENAVENAIYRLSLPAGNAGDPAPGHSSQPWQQALARVERARAEQAEGMDLSGIPTLELCRAVDVPLIDLVGKVLETLTGR